MASPGSTPEDPGTTPGPTAGVSRTRAELSRLRPDLTAGYDSAVPVARAAILARLLGALDREPLPGITADRTTAGSTAAGPSTAELGISAAPRATTRHTMTGWRTTAAGATISYPAHAAELFAAPAPDLFATVSTDRAGTPGDRRRRQGPPSSRERQDGWEEQGGWEGLDGRRVHRDQARRREEHRTGPDTRAWDGAARPSHGPAEDSRAEQSFDDPAALVRRLWPEATALATEIDNSVANLALARAARTLFGDEPISSAPGDPDGLGRLEQRDTDGHPLHPCCRTRGGMTVADVLRYGPEHRPVIRLRKLRVPADRWFGDAPPLLYAHPWQADRLRAEFPWLTDVGETGPVRPLMSLRTVAPLDGGDHIKTAVDVQMTSAIRTVSPAAVHNGPVLSRLLARLTRDLPLDVLAETAAGAVLVDGVPQRRLAYLRRQAPRIGGDETVLPLALADAAVAGDPYRWLADLAKLLFPALLTVLDRGVALEAHGQNTLVVLRAGRPVRIVYRDLGGVRVSPNRLRAAGLTPPEVHGDLVSDDPHVLRTKLTAAAAGTVAAGLVMRLARRYDAEPSRLWGIVAAAIRASGTADAAAILRDPLPVKATTAMRLAADPLDDIWARLDNPLAGAS